MIIEKKLREHLNTCYQQLKQRNNAQTVTKSLSILLDKTKTVADFQKEIGLLQIMIESEQCTNIEISAAMWLLSVCYEFGLGVPYDHNRGKQLLQKSVDLGCDLAFYELAINLYHGAGGFEKDLKLSAKLMRKAALQGCARAQNALGIMLVNGEGGVTQDIKEAVSFLTQAAEQGSLSAQKSLGQVYSGGFNGVSKDHTKALQYFTLAAAQGNVSANHHIGNIYMTGGHGVEKDLHKAYAFFTEAYEHGYVPSLANLGWYHLTGTIVKKDTKKATEYFTAAETEAENAFAESSLSKCYFEGIGVDYNPDRAMLLAKLALKNGQNNFQNYVINQLTTSKSDHFFPVLEGAIKYYSSERDFAMLGFCHQIGLNQQSPRDVCTNLTKAIALYDLENNSHTTSCYMDLMQCLLHAERNFSRNVSEGNFSEVVQKLVETFNKDVTKDYKEDIDKTPLTAKQCEKMVCLAYLSETGQLGVKQDFFKAAECYQKAVSENRDPSNPRMWVKERNAKFATLPAFRDAIREHLNPFGFQDGLVNVVLHYAFEPV